MAIRLNYRALVVGAILLMGTFLRFYHINELPPGLIQDEAAFGYNAYSVLQTGRDEYGQALPLVFRSFGDYKMPLYTYLSVVPIKMWGLNMFSLRFTSALAGSATVLIVFLLSRELFGRNRFGLGALCMLLFAISPWSIFFSRGGHEANVGLFLFLFGLWVQLVAFRKNRPRLLIVSAVMFALTTYTYIAFKFLSLVVFPATFILYKRSFSQLLLAGSLFLLLASPQYYLMQFAAGSNRISSLYDSQRVIPRYVSYFSPRSLFFAPDPDGNKSMPDLSAFYPWMVVPYVWGLYAVCKMKSSSAKFVFLTVLAATPFAASIARDPFSNIRALPFVFPVTLLIGLGMEKILEHASKRVSAIILVGILIVSGLALYRNYFVLLPHLRYNDWLQGYQELSLILEEKYSNKPVFFNDPRGVYYAELLFFTQYPPEKYQQENKAAPLPNYYNNLDFDPTHEFGRIKTGALDWGSDSIDQIIVSGPLGISPAQATEHSLEEVFTIKGPDNSLIFTGYQTHPELKSSEKNK